MQSNAKVDTIHKVQRNQTDGLDEERRSSVKAEMEGDAYVSFNDS